MAKTGKEKSLQNLRPYTVLSPEERKALTSAGGKAHAAKMRERKAIADTIRAILAEPAAAGSTVDKQTVLAANVLRRTMEEGRMGDLKQLAEILGELKVNVSTEGNPFAVIVQSQGDADTIKDVLEARGKR